MNSQERINQLYPGARDAQHPGQSTITREQQSTPAEPAPGEDIQPAARQSTEEIQEQMYKPKSEQKQNPYSLDPGSTEDQMYGSSQTLKLDEDLTLSGVSDQDQAEVRTNVGFIAYAAGATSGEIDEINTYVGQQLTLGEAPDPQETYKTLMQQHGADLNRKLDDVRLLVNSFPNFAQWANETQMGNDIGMINRVMTLSQTPKAQSRINQIRKAKEF